MRARWLVLCAVALAGLTGCELGELLNPTPMCPKVVAFDTVGWVVVKRNGVPYDSAAMTANPREVCAPRRYTGGTP